MTTNLQHRAFLEGQLIISRGVEVVQGYCLHVQS